MLIRGGGLGFEKALAWSDDDDEDEGDLLLPPPLPLLPETEEEDSMANVAWLDEDAPFREIMPLRNNFFYFIGIFFIFHS